MTTEIDSFVRKFKSLRDAGLEASFNLETKLGEVVISIRCKVGRDIPLPPLESPSDSEHRARKIYRIPSYYRRQAWCRARKDAQNSVLAAQVNDKMAAEVDSIDELGKMLKIQY